MNHLPKLLCFAASIGLLGCEPKLSDAYQVKKIPAGTLIIDGQGDHPAWQQAAKLGSFSYPWREDAAPATAFQALWDGDWLYFRYRAEDAGIVTPQTGEPEKDVLGSDRVEIFFKADDAMDPYYTLEMDALGRVFDAECRFYRQVDAAWSWPAGQLRVYASQDAGGYVVEGAIGMESLRQLGMIQGNVLQAVYRGEYLPRPDGSTETRWISWIKPDSEKPDFHIPSSFGRLVLED